MSITPPKKRKGGRGGPRHTGSRQWGCWVPGSSSRRAKAAGQSGFPHQKGLPILRGLPCSLVSRLLTKTRGICTWRTHTVASDMTKVTGGEYSRSTDVRAYLEERAIRGGTDLEVQKCFGTVLQSTILVKTWSGQWSIKEITLLIRLNLSINGSPRERLPIDLSLVIAWSEASFRKWLLPSSWIYHLGINYVTPSYMWHIGKSRETVDRGPGV